MTTNRQPFRIVKYGIAILLAGITGIFLGHFLTRYETRLLFNREYCGSYRGIEVYKCGEPDSENAAYHLQMLEKAPETLTEGCTAIYLTSGSLPLPETGGNAEALGLTQGTTVFVTTDSFYPDVLLHELFHAYDHANDMLSDSEEFREIFGRESDRISVVCVIPESERAEFFAAAGAEYLLKPISLLENAPETYRYLDGKIKAYD